MRLDLLFAPGGFKLRDQVCGTDDVLAQTAQKFDGPGIDQGNGEDDVVRGILHGDVAAGSKHRFQAVE